MCVSEQCANPILTFLHGRGNLSIYHILYLQGISAISVVLTDVRKQLSESSVYPSKQILQALWVPQKPSEYKAFFFFPRYPEFLILEFFMEAGQGGMRDNSFLSLVPGLLPASSFISTVPEMQPWVEHEFSLPPNQLRKAANGCWWHLLSWTVFYCFYSITSNWKVSQIFRKQLSDIYRGENESSQRCFSKWCCPASLICHYSQCVKHQDGCF